ncbi:MAG TPA: prolyl oligopeptidase family serine peptidase [Arenibacter sp.]|nr:prolyl oligopeptidase family serine peptidase [Arenibacter sp.]
MDPNEYHKWSDLYPMGISSNGKWASGFLRYDQGTDTLFIKHTQNNRTYYLPRGTSGQFSAGSQWFAFLDPKKGLGLLALSHERSTIQWTENVHRFDFSKDGRYLLLELQEKESRQLKIKDLKRELLQTIGIVEEYQWNPERNLLAYIKEQGKSVHLITFGKKLDDVLLETSASEKYNSLTWNHSGTALAFLKGSGSDGLGIRLYNNLPQDFKGFGLLESTDTMFFKERRIIDRRLIVSDDGQQVFFKVKCSSDKGSVQISEFDAKVQVWDTQDTWIYPRKKANASLFESIWDAVWWVETGSLMQITDMELPKMVLTGDQKYALTYSPLAYEPAPVERGDIDLYITSLWTGKKELLLERQPDYLGITKISPEGKYISYYRDGHWWVYNIRQGTHTNVTKDVNQDMYDITYDRPIFPPPYGHPGWTEGDRSLLVYGKFDIWEISPDGKLVKRLTHGKREKEQFRVYESKYRNEQLRYESRFEGIVLKLAEPILLEGFNITTKINGFYNLQRGRDLKVLERGKSKLDRFFKADGSDAYLYREQTYELSPRLIFRDFQKEDGKTLYQSNPQQERFQWGKSELISYTNAIGDSLQGVLLYPAGYELGKKYPMIVKIYEKQSDYLHNYKKPSFYEMSGFNATNFILEGYVVLLPDIAYHNRGPGLSALDCTISAVKEAIGMGMVDTTKIGLIGHSFGGYETNFIITQTDTFAAAISGASVSDLISFQFSIDWNNTWKSQEWHLTQQQLRIKDNYYDNKSIFRKNDPIEHVDNISTPLLLWTGDKDYHGNWLQEVEFYLALKSLQKRGKLLLYEGEGHVLLEPNNQRDLNQRIMEWFDFYLKKPNKESWIGQVN